MKFQTLLPKPRSWSKKFLLNHLLRLRRWKLRLRPTPNLPQPSLP
jgi:hypothetical protein